MEDRKMSILKNRVGHVTVVGTLLVMTPVFASVQAQVKSAPYTKNAVCYEGLGEGGLYSLNYDHRFASDLSVRAGVTAWPFGGEHDTFGLGVGIIALPLTVNYLLGGDGNYLELGWGLIPVFGIANVNLFWQTTSSSKSMILGTGVVGYRYQPMKNGMIFRIDFTPFFNLNNFAPWGGISVGYAF